MIKKNKRTIKVLIPNGTSPTNIGDQAMLEVLVNLINTTYKNASLTVHSVDPNLYKNESFTARHTLYSWSVFKNKQAISRIMNMTKLISQYLIIKSGIPNFSLDKKLGLLINDYKNADLIIFAGGGYLRSKKGITQSLNLMMQLSVFLYAALFSAKKIVAPVSVGPFGYKWHEKTVVKVLKQMDIVTLREEFSYKLMHKNKMKNIVLFSDVALMTKKLNSLKSNQDLTVGFTVREWLNGVEALNFEKHLINTITKFSKLTGAKIQPIVQVDASKYGEDDVKATNRIVSALKSDNLSMLKTKKITTVKNALETYSNIDILLGMRMHSNILAAIQRTPFVAISYEYKTEGIARNLGMENYCIKCEDIDEKNLLKLLVDVYKKRKIIRNKIDASIRSNMKTEVEKWNNILKK